MKKVILLGIPLLLLVGCSQKFQEPFKDAPVASHNNSPAVIVEMPDGFSNISAKCEGPNRVYVVYHGNRSYGTVAVAPNDPRCTGK